MLNTLMLAEIGTGGFHTIDDYCPEGHISILEFIAYLFKQMWVQTTDPNGFCVMFFTRLFHSETLWFLVFLFLLYCLFAYTVRCVRAFFDI